MTWTKLTSIEKVRDQIDTIEKLWTKLKYGLKDMDQICSLPKKEREREREREKKKKSFRDERPIIEDEIYCVLSNTMLK